MTTEQTANRLVELCRQAKWEDAFKELYSHECVSIEPAGGQWPERTEGAEAMMAKGEQFNNMVEEFHGVEVSDPTVANNFFTCRMDMDVTFKGMPRMNNSELCLFEVNEDGKIIREQFFYPLPPK